MSTWIAHRLTVIGIAALHRPVDLAAQRAGRPGRDRHQGRRSTFVYPVLSSWSREYRAALARGGDFPMRQLGARRSAGEFGARVRAGRFAGGHAARQGPRGRFRCVRHAAEVGRVGDSSALASSRSSSAGSSSPSTSTGIGPGEIRLTGPLLADIFLGKITHWSDPAIKALNPGADAPRRPDRRRSPFGRLGHDVQLHGLPVESQPGVEAKVGSALLVPGRPARERRVTKASRRR